MNRNLNSTGVLLFHVYLIHQKFGTQRSYGNSVITNASSLRYFHANETQTIPITFVDFMLRLFYFVECLCLLLLTFFFFSFAKSNVSGNRGHGYPQNRLVYI